MFDILYCDVELPDKDVPPGSRFQTKSFPPLFLKYRITKTGRLIDARGRDLEVDGYVTFYPASNPLPENALWPEYRARFIEGQLHAIVRVAEEVESRVYGLAAYRQFAIEDRIPGLRDVPDPPADGHRVEDPVAESPPGAKAS